ncbi:SRPBCC domain-containing protein [Streptomyces iconiensis]|uniref:SRPBCC domain-containing protein n=1 Tax=Streptomyces iconiensis TaxID=1384038 RepID=A0ABT6ZXM1_9ACTN|nr:SRPBCC domain-containing protein [Streptomyces iconiensis]MDJ1133820.1 SRPBCC domain-containing protein [Streptomyces iconiensis]
MSTESQSSYVPYGEVPYGSTHSSPDGAAHTIGFELEFPHPVDSVWAAVATPGGLSGWLATADPFEPGPGGAVTLRWLKGGPSDEDGPELVAPGRITAWSRRRLAEYTVDARGSFGFTLRGTPDDDRTRVRFRNDFTGDEESRVDRLAGWHQHFELLHQELDDRPTDWSGWTPERFAALRAEYASREG